MGTGQGTEMRFRLEVKENRAGQQGRTKSEKPVSGKPSGPLSQTSFFAEAVSSRAQGISYYPGTGLELLLDKLRLLSFIHLSRPLPSLDNLNLVEKNSPLH